MKNELVHVVHNGFYATSRSSTTLEIMDKEIVRSYLAFTDGDEGSDDYEAHAVGMLALARFRLDSQIMRAFNRFQRNILLKRRSRRLLAMAIKHDYSSRLLRALRIFASATKPKPAVEYISPIDEARNWYSRRLVTEIFGRWISYIRTEKEVELQLSAVSDGFFRQQASRQILQRISYYSTLSRALRRKLIFGETYNRLLVMVGAIDRLKLLIGNRGAYRVIRSRLDTARAYWGKKKLRKLLGNVVLQTYERFFLE
jgi:hypothetical protein